MSRLLGHKICSYVIDMEHNVMYVAVIVLVIAFSVSGGRCIDNKQKNSVLVTIHGQLQPFLTHIAIPNDMFAIALYQTCYNPSSLFNAE